MGQAHSGEHQAPVSHEQLTRALAKKFADKCFTPLEIYSLKEVFKSLADHQQNVRYVKEDTIARFLELPDILGVSPVVFQMVSYIAAFPFLQDAPAILGLEQMLIVITILTKRYRRVLAKGPEDLRKLIYKSLAVYDRRLSEMGMEHQTTKEQRNKVVQDDDSSGAPRKSHAPGFTVDEVGEEEAVGSDEEDDGLALTALELFDFADGVEHDKMSTTHGSMIPGDNFRKLIMLLLLAAPLEQQDRLSASPERLMGSELESLRSTADSILAAFLDVETSPGINFSHFDAIIPASMPFLFEAFTNLFEKFLFPKSLDLSKRKDGSTAGLPTTAGAVIKPPTTKELARPPPLVFKDSATAIMNFNILSQLSFFLPGSDLFHRLRLLYSGNNDGFSMGSFESSVFNWRAPTILLVRGSRLPFSDPAASTSEAAFLNTIPPRRFPPDSSCGSQSKDEDDDSAAIDVTFGIYVDQPWRHTNRECFGGDEVLLFQLSPVHDVFRAASLSHDRVSFVKPSASTSPAHAGISAGCPPPSPRGGAARQAAMGFASLGPVSLLLDSSFEFGCFTHDFESRAGGAFTVSVGRRRSFQERFAVQSLEVWGCGGDKEAQAQAERWAWEAREAEARRRINLGTGDIEADRALLEMAGLVGANRSGGSMG